MMEKECETTSLIKRPPMSISSIVDRMGFGKFQCLLLVMYSLVTIIFTMQTFMIGVLAYVLDNNWDLSDLSVGLYSLAMLLAMAVGCLLSNLLEDRLTRWVLVKLSLLFIVIFSLLSAVCQGIACFTACRFMVITATFLLFSASLSSTSEMLPSKIRGTLLAICGATGIIGYSVVTAFSYSFMPEFEGEHWRFMVVMLGVMPCKGTLMLSIYLIEDSPVYLAKHEKHLSAVAGLERMAKLNKLPGLSEAERDVVMSQRQENTKFTKFVNLFETETKKQSIALLMLWIIAIAGYSGVLSVYPYLLGKENDPETIYLTFLLLIIIEIPAMGTNIYIVDNPNISKKMAMAGLSIVTLTCLLLPVISTHDTTIVASISLYIPFRYGLLICLMLYTSGFYRAELRASAIAYFSMLALAVSVGVSPLLLFLVSLNHILAFTFLATLEILALGCIFLIPIETGKSS